MRKFIYGESLKNIVLIVLFLIFWEQVFSQSSDKVGLEFTYNRGFIYPHHKQLQYLTKSNINFFEVAFCLPTSGKKDWQVERKYPVVGLKLLYADFKFPQVLGKAYGFTPFIELPLAIKNKSSLVYGFSSGLAYMSKTFDTQKNVYNTMISSKISSFGLFEGVKKTSTPEILLLCSV